MIYELQGYYRLDTDINFGSNKFITLGQYLRDLLIKYKGKFDTPPKQDDICFMLWFPSDDVAVEFLEEYREKLSPRMFTQDTDGAVYFL